MIKNINKTLLEVLEHREQYEKLGFSKLIYDRAFPRRDLWIQFLRCNNYDEKIGFAMSIISRLSFHCSASPPQELIDNILDSETYNTGNYKGGFIAKDHYIHLIYLYLLGIYIYLKHNGLNKQINLYMNKTKKITDIQDGCSEFINCWKLFVLYHDIGYPFECYSYNEINELKVFIDCFSKTREYALEKTSSVIFSNIMTAYKVISSQNQKTLKYILGDSSFPNADLYFECPTIVSGVSFNSVFTVIDKKDMAVLFQDSKEKKCGFILYYNEKSDRVDCYKSCIDEDFPQQTIESAFFDFYYSLGVKWTKKYFIKHALPSFSSIACKMTGYPSSEFIDKIKKANSYIENKLPLVFEMSTSESDLSEYLYQINEVIKEITNFYKNEKGISGTSSNRMYSSPLKKELISISQNDINQRVEKYFDTYIREESKRTDRKISFDTIIENIITSLFSEKEIITQELIKNNKIHFEAEIEEIENIKSLLDGIQTQTGMRLELFNDLTNVSIDESSSFYAKLSEKAIESLEVFGHIKERLQKNNIEFTELLSYRPSSAKDLKTYFDHGISSAIIMANILGCYKLYINKLCDNKQFLIEKEDVGFYYYIFNIYSRTKKGRLYDLFHTYYEDSIYAVLVHNIFCNDFNAQFGKKPQFRTSLLKEPFAYLAILCDSLQPWDRKRIINPAISHIPYSVYGDKFNIEVIGNYIYISEEGENMDIKKRVDDLRDYLKNYLENIDTYIKLSLSQDDKSSKGKLH
jgi:hypothetical protein